MKRANTGIKPGELVDRISSLPDSILSLILSFLPTKNSVHTCLVSKRWEFLWRTVINLDFCQDDEESMKSVEPELEVDMKFARFVNSVLLLHDVGFLNKFRLVWKPRCFPSQINPWITTAITRHVRELVVCLKNSDRTFQLSRSIFNCGTLQSLEFNGYAHVSALVLVCLPRLESLKLDSVCFQSEEAFEKLIIGCPMLKYLHLVMSVENSDRSFQMSRSVFSCSTLLSRSVFNCSTLLSLRLKGYMFVSAASTVCLPRLESLKIDSVCFQSEEAFEILISRCPKLKYLRVRNCNGKMTKYRQTYQGTEICAFKFVVSSTSLRRLKLYFEFQPDHEGDCVHSNLELNASSLEYLKLDGYISRIHVQESLSSLVEADFGIKVCECEWNKSGVGDSLMKALDASNCAKAVTLSEESMWALKQALNLNLARYGTKTGCRPIKFKRLVKLKAGADCCYANVLQYLMQSSDSLEVLTLDKLMSWDCADASDYHGLWDTSEEVPICLSNSLKAIEFTNYAGFDYEREMVGYMLKHGIALEVMKLTCYSCIVEHTYEYLQEINKFPRNSPTCKIDFMVG